MQQNRVPQPSPWGKSSQPRGRSGRRFPIVVAVFALLLFALFSAFPPSTWREGEELNVVRAVLVGVFALMTVAASRQRLIVAAAQMAAWVAIGFVLLAVYAYQSELKAVGRRTLAVLLPSQGQSLDERTLVFTRASDRHFWIDATVDGQPIRFLLDTGASSVMLTRRDAERLGFDPHRLVFRQEFQTANGATRAAPVELAHLQIGEFEFDRVGAWVNEGDARDSLLGMRFLERLTSIEISGDTLTIRR